LEELAERILRKEEQQKGKSHHALCLENADAIKFIENSCVSSLDRRPVLKTMTDALKIFLGVPKEDDLPSQGGKPALSMKSAEFPQTNRIGSDDKNDFQSDRCNQN